MIEENGLPKLGSSSATLGIRPGIDIVIDSSGQVHLPAFRPGEKNGLSCAATVDSLPKFTKPLAWGGLNKRTVVWGIEDADLPVELVARDDAMAAHNRHISIGPSTTMDYNDFVRAIEATRPLWKKITKN